jgi:phosphate transport system substrate-binding protein
MNNEEMGKAKSPVIHVPTVMGAVVLSYNLPEIKQPLKFSGEMISDIYMGKIKKWNDAKIAALNKGVKLPETDILPVYRADGSGTTAIFTDYLAKVSAEWKEKVGAGKAVSWPAGLSGKGNEGVAGLVKQTKNSIGYSELIYATQNNLSYASVKNQSGKFVKASVEGISAAAASAQMPKDFRVSITNAPGENSYPISTFTWLLVYENNGGSVGKTLKDFLGWMLEDGQKLAPALGYAPLPENVRQMVKNTITKVS